VSTHGLIYNRITGKRRNSGGGIWCRTQHSCARGKLHCDDLWRRKLIEKSPKGGAPTADLLPFGENLSAGSLLKTADKEKKKNWRDIAWGIYHGSFGSGASPLNGLRKIPMGRN